MDEVTVDSPPKKKMSVAKRRAVLKNIKSAIEVNRKKNVDKKIKELSENLAEAYLEIDKMKKEMGDQFEDIIAKKSAELLANFKDKKKNLQYQMVALWESFGGVEDFVKWGKANKEEAYKLIFSVIKPQIASEPESKGTGIGVTVNILGLHDTPKLEITADSMRMYDSSENLSIGRHNEPKEIEGDSEASS